MKNKTLAVMLLGSSFLITNALAATGVGEDKKIDDVGFFDMPLISSCLRLTYLRI